MTQPINSEFGDVKIELQSNFYNNWPKIEIAINDQTLWADYIVEHQIIDLRFSKLPINTLKISYVNKRNGPGVYDTLIDSTGQILQDQYCILKTIYFDKAKLNNVINKLDYHLLNGEVQSGINGWMPQCGSYIIEFPYSIYDWIIDLRNKNNMAGKRQSSLSYFTSYLGDNNNKDIDDIIGRISKIIKSL